MILDRPMALREVARVKHANGSHIEPPLDQAWSDLEKLRWHAAVLRVDTGVVVEVLAGGMRDSSGELPGWFRLFSVDGQQRGPMQYGPCWDFINGMQFGIKCKGEQP